MEKSIWSWNEYILHNHQIIGLRGPLTSIKYQLSHVKHDFDASNCHRLINNDVFWYEKSILGISFFIQIVYVTLTILSGVSEDP